MSDIGWEDKNIGWSEEKSCRTIAEKFNIGKTQVANVMKNESKLRKEFETVQGKGFEHLKRENHQKFKAINEILYTWYEKCEASGIYVMGLCLKRKPWTWNNL